MSIAPIEACKLVLRCYDPAVVAGELPDLASDGFTARALLYARDENTSQPVCYGLAATRPDDSDLIFALRGTDDFTEWLEDAQVWMAINPWGAGRVHYGFCRLCASLGVGTGLDSLSALIGPGKAVSVAGHSLGGAMARLLSLRLGKVEGIFTFGEPKSCDASAAQGSLNCAASNHRAVNPNDWVPKVPDFDPLEPVVPYVHARIETRLAPWASLFEPKAAHDINAYVRAEQGLSNP